MNGLSNEEKARLILSVGRGGSAGKRLLSPMQIAKLLERSIEGGGTPATVATQLKIGSDMVNRFLSLLKLPVSVQSLVEFASSSTSLSFSVAHQIARIADSNTQEELARTALAYDLSKQDVGQVVQRLLRSGNSLEQAVAAILALRPIIERRHIIIGAITSSILSDRIRDASNQDRRNIWARKSLNAIISDGVEFDVRVTPERFTISGGENLFDKVRLLKPDLETAINAALTDHINVL